MPFLLRLLALLALVVPFASSAARVKVPVDVGVGPAAYWFFGPLTDNRWPTPHFGLKLNVAAVLDAEWIAANRSLVPGRYRKAAEDVDEVRITPSIFIPDALIISPKVDSLGGTGIYGITWRPLAFRLPLGGKKQPGSWQKSRGRFDLGAGLLFTYAFIYSDFLPTTHFLRPGIDLGANVELAASSNFLVSFGWTSQLYVPQKLGSFGFGPFEQSIFHVGQAYLKLHFRVPYETSI